ncbi:hypothetical protein [Otoolea muris]
MQMPGMNFQTRSKIRFPPGTPW